MPRACVLLLGFLIVILTASINQAQEPKEAPKASYYVGADNVQFRSTFTTLSILFQPSYNLDELKLTAAQKVRRKGIVDELARRKDAFRAELTKLAEEPDLEARAVLSQRVRTAQNVLNKEAEAALLSVLDSRQRARLFQLQLQLAGTAALTRPDVQERLNMDPAQIELIKQAIDEGRQEIERFVGVPPALGRAVTADPQRKGGVKVDPAYKDQLRDALQKRSVMAQKARESIDQRIFKLLTKRQRETFRKMLGEPVDLAKLQGFAKKPASGQNEKPAPDPNEKAAPRQS
jgi:hypothetical protein